MITAFLTYFYRTQRVTRAQQFFKQGNELMQADRYEEAVEQYRHALSISHTTEERLALGMALVKAGHLEEAEIYLNQVLRQNPNSGPANVGLGRILLQRGEIAEALKYYHRAIYGAWRDDPQANRLEARLELINALGKAGAKQQAQAELLALAADMPPQTAMRKRIGQLLLEYGLPRNSAGVFSEIAQKNRNDAEAQSGLGEAELASGDFSSAEKSFREAVRLDAANATYQKRLQLVERVIALDPAVPGLHASDRFERGRKLLEAAVGAFDQCGAGWSEPVPEDFRGLADSARKILLRHGRPRSYSDEADSDINLAERIWGARIKLCGPATPAEEPLSRVMARLPK